MSSSPLDSEESRGASGSGTRDRLLDAAIHIAGTLGPEKVTYRSVGAEAGQSHGLVRFSFGTRESMLTLAFERAALRDAEQAQLLVSDLQSFGANLVKTISEDQPRQLLQYDFALRAARGGGPIEPVVALYDHYIAQVAGTLAHLGLEGEDGTIADLVFAALDGLVLQHVIYDDPDRMEAALTRLRHLLGLLQDRQKASGA